MKTLLYILLTTLFTSCVLIDSKSIIELYGVTKSSVVIGGQEQVIDSLFNKTKFDKDSFFVKLNWIKKELDSYEYYDMTSKKDTNNCIIQVIITKNKDTTKTTIELSGTPFYREIQVDISRRLAFISWVSVPFYRSQIGESNPNEQYELKLKIIELNTGNEIFNNTIYTTKCCIDRLSMKYNPFTKSILLAFNNFSYSDSKHLRYGFIQLNGDDVISPNLEPRGIILQDHWEKRNPDFLINDKALYLYHSTGDYWSFWEHAGIKQIGISRIDNKNNPTDYRLITDTCVIDGKAMLIGDTIFFKTRIETNEQPDRMIIKKASLNDLIKHDE